MLKRVDRSNMIRDRWLCEGGGGEVGENFSRVKI